jgi:S1-C subfamily serine protease
MARSVMEQLIRNGEIRRGRLGVAIQDVTPDIAEALGLERATGAIVTSVEPGSPAARAGIQARDVVVAVDGESIEDASALRNKVGLTSAGRTVELRLIRAGRAMNLKVRVEERRTGG